jgi:hypothetical protein
VYKLWQYNYNTRQYVPLSETIQGTYTNTVLTYVKSRSWTRTDNFRVLKATGLRLPDNPYALELRTATTMSGSVNGPFAYFEGKQAQTQWRFSAFTVSIANPSHSLVNTNDVYAKLIDRVKGSGFNAPVFLAESRQTASMVVQRATSIVSGLRALRKGNLDEFMGAMHKSFNPPKRKVRNWREHLRSDTKGSTKAASSIWLEARYGWLPFLSEVHSAFESLNEIVERQENLYARVSARKKAERVLAPRDESLISLGADGGLKMEVRETQYEEIKAVWVFVPTEWDGLGRLGLTNPLEVAWELVPFSFVADWFLPVGNYLSYLDVQQRFKHVGGTVGLRRERVLEYSKPRQTFTSGGAGSSISGFTSCRATAVTITRSRLLSAPIPSLESIAFNPNLNSKRVIDSIALIRQLAFK